MNEQIRTTNLTDDNRTILLVEDDRKLVSVTKRMLELRGYKVRAALDVSVARRALTEYIPDLILMDINLPGGDGLELCREIRAFSNVPIIFVTGLEKTDELLERGFDAGGDDYMMKPVNFNELVLRIEALLRRVEKARKAKAQDSGRETNVEINEEEFNNLTVNMEKREKEIARMIALGKSNQEIAKHMGYSSGYIKNVATLIYAQMNVANRCELRKILLMD